MRTLQQNLLILIAILTLILPTMGIADSLSDYTVSPRDEHGRILGTMGREGHDVFPVYFTEINGHRVTGQRDVLWLKPGEYEIKAAIMPSAFQRKIVGATRPGNRIEVEPLQLVVEEGKDYRIGGLHLHRQEGSQRRAFRLVLWKVDDGEGDSHYPDLPAMDSSDDGNGEDEDS
ncbi:hypothetical protein J2T60_001558 [Natronospira proteinivora]|uniref:DUF2846 domain-containing protein n=1 Tax=Natronospira proteinivora TaxID=1807133 RepID=A0ABT1G8A3_9GAMM|nr:hypothetical protein [Natronospira proteinivora]MCP1727558.1 hypothetical protein [Natronospira proteinivora]